GSFVGCDVGATVWVAATVGVELPPFESSRVMTMAAATPPAIASNRPPKSAASAHPEADPPELGACRATRAVGFRRTIGVATVWPTARLEPAAVAAPAPMTVGPAAAGMEVDA